MTKEQKDLIDSMDYIHMLSHVRFDPPGSIYFSGGEISNYFMKVTKEKREKIGDIGHTNASKIIGW